MKRNLLFLLCIAVFAAVSNTGAFQISRISGGCGQNIVGQPPEQYPDKVLDSIFADSIIIRVNFRGTCCIPYKISISPKIPNDTIIIQDTCSANAMCYCACICYYQYRIKLGSDVSMPAGLTVVKINSKSSGTTLFSGLIPTRTSHVSPHAKNAHTSKKSSGHFFDFQGKRISIPGRGVYISGLGKYLSRMRYNLQLESRKE